MEIKLLYRINTLRHSNLIKSSAIYTIINFVNKAFPFFLLPLLTRAFTLNEYGTFSIYRATINMCIPLVGLSLSEAVIRGYYEKERMNFGTYIFSVLFVNIGTIGLLELVILLFGNVLFGIVGLSKEMLCIVLLISFFTSIINIERGLYRCEKKNTLFSIVVVGQSLIYFVIIFLLYWFHKLHIRAAVYAEVAVYFLFAIIGGWYLVKKYSISFEVKKQYVRDAIVYSFPLVINSMMAYAFALSDRYIINYQLGEASVAIYSASFQVVSILQILGVSFNAAWVPWVFESLAKKMNFGKLLKVGLGAAFLFLVFGIVFWSVVNKFLPVFVGEKYKAGISLLGWFIGANIFQAIYCLVAPVLQYYKKNWYLLLASVPAFLFSIILDVSFLKEYGLGFAARVNFFSWLIIFVITFIYSLNLIKYVNKWNSNKN